MKLKQEFTIYLCLLTVLGGILILFYIFYQIHLLGETVKAADFKVDIIKNYEKRTNNNRQLFGNNNIIYEKTKIPSISDIKKYDTEEKIQFSGNSAIKKEIKTYVLSEAKKSGLDPVFVDKLIQCESTWNPKAISPKGGNRGLWQINKIHKIPDSCSLDYKCSTKWAIAKRLRDGNWNAWSCTNIIK